MEEKKLYPFKFVSIRDDYDWGSEEFLLADLGYRDNYIKEGWLASNTVSELMDMYMDRVVGDNVFEWYGRQFPFQVKRIIVNGGRMPLRVHPDDETASQRWDSLGKEKCWYVLRAGKDARVALGFKQDTDASELYAACLESVTGEAASRRLAEMLNVQCVHEGECLRIAPGTVHAAAGDVTLVEVSESSPMDFCLSGWGCKVSGDEFDPALSLVDALDFIDYRKYVHDASLTPGRMDEPKSVKRLIDIDQFTVSEISLSDPLHIYSDKFNSFLTYFCLSGEASVRTSIDGIKMDYQLKEGEVMVIPADCPDFILSPVDGGTRLLEIMMEKRSAPDAYINPLAAAAVSEDGEAEDSSEDDTDS